jgi:predicted AAA+ superfamily ATPase
VKHSSLSATLLALDSLSIYRGLLENRVFLQLRKLLYHLSEQNADLRTIINDYHDFYFELANTGSLSLKDYVLEQFLFNENLFTLTMQAQPSNNQNDELDKAVCNDLANLQLIAELDSLPIKKALAKLSQDHSSKMNVDKFPAWGQANLGLPAQPDHLTEIKRTFLAADHWEEGLEELKSFHRNYGSGLFARYIAFVWERSDGHGYLKGIENSDPIRLNTLIEYEDERLRVIENTLQFLQGFPANNVLLYGDRGTGKSSTVKAILNEYYAQGLRMLEVPKAYLADFPLIIRQLKNRSQKFIIFVDDLVFGDDEENYTSLKAVLEGGLESKTPNILIYATSNRRHLVKEYFSERAGLQSGNHDEEVHAADSMQEKLSLADRFGIHVVFSSPDQKKYLKIVEGLAAQRNLEIDTESLHQKALQWEMRYNGRSARTARQFVDWLEGQNSAK